MKKLLQYWRLQRTLSSQLTNQVGMMQWQRAWETGQRKHRLRASWHGRRHVAVPYWFFIKQADLVLYDALQSIYAFG